MRLALPLFAALLLSACAEDSGIPQHDDDPAIFTLSIPDPVGDLVAAPAESPPSVPSYPSVDVREVGLGVRDGWLYLRFSFAGAIPREPPVVDGETVRAHGVNLSMDSDLDATTGAGGEGIAGIDVYFACSFHYGHSPTAPYANFGVTADVHVYEGSVAGEYRSGGPGYDFVTFRFPADEMGAWLPRGGTVRVGGWSEAESVAWHHFAFDPFTAVEWTVP